MASTYPLLAITSPALLLEDVGPSRATLLLKHVNGGRIQLARSVLHESGVQSRSASPWGAWAERSVRQRSFTSREQAERLMAQEHEELAAMCLAYLDAGNAEISWMVAALSDVRRWLVALLAEQVGYLHPELEAPMIDAGASEPNPSLNRTFIEIAMWSAGPERVLRRYRELMRSGDPVFEAGAARALYWVRRGGVAPPIEEVVELFLKTKNIDMQRYLIANLTSLSCSRLSTSDAAALQLAVTAARLHGDDYIRHRADLFDGTEELIRPLPPSKP